MSTHRGPIDGSKNIFRDNGHAQMNQPNLNASLRALLAESLERSGGVAIESICLASLALRHNSGPEVKYALQVLQRSQNCDGSCAPLLGDEGDGCWTTAIFALVLIAFGAAPERLRHAIKWLLHARGREANWFWRWKFKIIDTSVKFDPSKYGWSWVRESALRGGACACLPQPCLAPH